MNVEITGRHVVITAAIRSYVLKRLRKFEKFFGDDASFHVIIDVEKERHTAEILLRSKLLDLTGKGETDDMYTSIVRAIEKIERQAVENKSRLIETKRQKARARSVEEKSGIRQSKVPPRMDRGATILEEELPRKAMAVDDAAAVLVRSEYPFVAFRNVESGAMNILYRRKDGTLGLIQD
ncbi:MAG: ribosome-associated translation inhibitor RaiA [Acidobacteriota bacterium]|jgi:putative sigma-54 modulation protein